MKPALLGLAGLVALCGAADAKPANNNRPAVLTVAPFTLTLRAEDPDGSSRVAVYRGDKYGLISYAKDGGKPRPVARATTDGRFISPHGPGKARLMADGTFILGSRVTDVTISEDGAVFRDGHEMFRLERGRMVLPDRLSSAVTIEGGDEVRRLVAAVLVLQLPRRSQR